MRSPPERPPWVSAAFTRASGSKFQGAPVDWKTYGEYIPVLSQGYSVSKKSPQPNLGRLFIAWLAMDGMKIYEEMEVTTRVTRKESPAYL